MATTDNKDDKPNRLCIISVSALTFVFPAVGVGLRLFLAGIKQVKNPEFTAKQIFHLESPDSFSILPELGFANIGFGLVAMVSWFKPEWRIVSACTSGLYYGIPVFNTN